MKNRTESALTLAAVVASLGGALGVAATDVQAATEAGTPAAPASRQIKLTTGQPDATVPSANYGKIESTVQKRVPPGAPGANQIKWEKNPPK